MLDKIVTVFRIPELRQKIFLTLILLAVYRMGFAIPLPIIDQAEFAKRHEAQRQSSFGQVMQAVSMFAASQIGMTRSSAWASCPTSRPRSSSSSSGPSIRRWKRCRRKAKRPEEDQRIHALRHRRALRGPERVLGRHDRRRASGRTSSSAA